MTFLLRHCPLVGTMFSAGECVQAAYQGNATGFFVKLGETALDAGMDALTIGTGGLVALVATPGKAAGKAAGKSVVVSIVTEVAQRALVRTVARKISDGILGIGKPVASKETKEVETTDDSTSTESGWEVVDPEGPILSYELGKDGRVEWLKARIKIQHISPDSPLETSQAVEKQVRSLGALKTDSVGHIVGGNLGGDPNDKYNCFPQSPSCRTEYEQKVEKVILDFLEKQKTLGNQDANVYLRVELVYSSDVNRPQSLKAYLVFSDAQALEKTISNC